MMDGRVAKRRVFFAPLGLEFFCRLTGLRRGPHSFAVLRLLVFAAPLLSFPLPSTAQHASGARTSKASTFVIAGRVVNAETGENLPGAVVSIGKAQGDDTIESVRAGEDGGFRFEGLGAGKYWLRGEARGFTRQAFDEHEGFFTGIVTGGEVDSEHLVFRLRPDAVIAGQIVDEANEPIREGQAMLFRRQVQEGRELTSMLSSVGLDDEGHYRFGHLAAGTYFVVVRAHPWYARSGETVRAGKVQSVETVPNTVVTNGTTAGQGSEESGSAEAEPDRGLDVTYPVTYYPGATEPSGATPLELQAGQRVTADMRLAAVPALHLRVRAAGAEDAENLRADVTQRIFDGPGQPVQGESMQPERGEVEVGGIAPGEYEIQVQSYGKNPQSWAQPLTVSGDADVTVGRQTAGATVKGTIRMEAGGAPMKSGFVQLLNQETGQPFGAQILEQGAFEFGEPVMPGRYQVNAGGTTRQDVRVSGIAASGAKVAGQTVEIGGSGTVQLTINMREGLGTINGTVLRAGKPLAGAMVVLVPQDIRNSLPLMRRDQSDLDGTFTLPAVVPGKYTVVAIPDGWERDWMSGLSGAVKGGEKVEVAGSRRYEVKVRVE